jgi:hypothetical protein
MSNKEASQYPVSQQIEKVIRNSGYTPLGFLLATGHSDSDTEWVLPRLESWLQKGQGDEAIIALVAAYDPGEAAALYKALAETVEMQAAGIDPVAYEKERREKIKRDQFKPFVRARGECRVPSAITCGYDRHTIHIPEAILTLSLEDQLSKLPEFMAAYRKKYNGTCPSFGKLTGFDFVRYEGYFLFDAEVSLLERHGEAWVELR